MKPCDVRPCPGHNDTIGGRAVLVRCDSPAERVASLVVAVEAVIAILLAVAVAASLFDALASP